MWEFLWQRLFLEENEIHGLCPEVLQHDLHLYNTNEYIRLTITQSVITKLDKSTCSHLKLDGFELSFFIPVNKTKCKWYLHRPCNLHSFTRWITYFLWPSVDKIRILPIEFVFVRNERKLCEMESSRQWK